MGMKNTIEKEENHPNQTSPNENFPVTFGFA